MPYTETETQLSLELSLADFNFMEPGNQTLTHIYQRVYETFPDLCNNEFLCSDCCGGIHTDPEWHHIVRGALSRSKEKEFSRVQKRANSHGYWFFAEINNL
jgi:hypothetical protein